MDPFDSLRSRLGGGRSKPEEHPSLEARASQTDGGQIVAEGGQEISIEIPEGADVDRDRIEAALSAQSGAVGVKGEAGGDTTVTPVASGSDIHISDSAFDLSNWEYKAFLDDQITNLMDNRVDYNQETGKWILANDDLIPGILIRLKSLMLGSEGLEVKPDDPDGEADQRLAEHLGAVYEGDAEVEAHVDPQKAVDSILEQNILNAVYVGRSTDLQHIDVDDLSYVKDGETGEEIYIQHPTSYTTFDIEDDGDTTVGYDHTEDEQALKIGEEVIDVRLYRTPPLQAVADDVVNKMQLKRLQGRKAELASIGGVIIKVNPPAWLPEEDYDNYVDADDDEFGDEDGRLLELVMAQQIEAALETLQEYQTATVMSIPENWETTTIELPEMDESMSSMIRDYNEAISRRLLLPLDLIELKEGPELSRNSMMKVFIDMVRGWQSQITDAFDQFAKIQAEIHGMNGEVKHELPKIEAQDEAEIIKLFNFAGLLGLSESEGRELANVLEGVDLDTDQTGDMPPEGGPEDPEQRFQQMRDALTEEGDEQGEPGESGDQPPDQGPAGDDQPPNPQGSAEASQFRRRDLLQRAEADLSDDGAVRATDDGDPICWVCGSDASHVHQKPPHTYACPDHSFDIDQVPIGEADIQAATSWSEGEEVETPDGMGVVVEVRTENFDGPGGDEVEASEDTPAYVVGVESGAEVFRDSDLSEGEIDAPVDDPEGDLADAVEAHASDIEAAGWMSVHAGPTDWDYPESWRESEQPARLILLKAWAGMNGQFDCGGDCCKGTMLRNGMSDRASDQFCAAMKDRVLMWEGWRRGGASKAPVKAKHSFSQFETMREAAAHVRDIVERKTPEGHTAEMKKRTDLDEGAFAVVVRDRNGDFQASMVVREAETEDGKWVVIGGNDFLG